MRQDPTKAELLSGVFYRKLGGDHFSLANGGCRLDVDDDRMVAWSRSIM